ncbi:MAG: hypothetical protein GXX90_02385 [Microbacteriaceae bacterium]|nr:hypothetical protein [Microbacteriaceae bacterium]
MTAAETDELARLRGELLAARLEVRELRARNDELQRRIDAEHASAVAFAQQVVDLRDSRSWKLTAPLRVVMRRGRG